MYTRDSCIPDAYDSYRAYRASLLDS
jgi:hypothetical protein